MKSDAIMEKIQQKLKESDPEKRTLMKVFQYNYTDNNGAIIKKVVWDLIKLQVYDGTVSDPDCEITVTDDDFYLVGTKQISFKALVDEGRVTVKGDFQAFESMAEKFTFNAKI